MTALSEAATSLRRIAAAARRLDAAAATAGAPGAAAGAELDVVRGVALELSGDARRLGGDRTTFRSAATRPEFERATLRGAVAHLRANAAVEVAAERGRTLDPARVVGADEQRMLLRTQRALAGLTTVLDRSPKAFRVRPLAGGDPIDMLLAHVDTTRDTVDALVETARTDPSPVALGDASRLRDVLLDTRTHLKRAAAATLDERERGRNLSIAHGYARTAQRMAGELATTASGRPAGAIDIMSVPAANTLQALDPARMARLHEDWTSLADISTRANLDEQVVLDARRIVRTSRNEFSSIAGATDDPAAHRVVHLLDDLDGRLVEAKAGLAPRVHDVDSRATLTAQPAHVARLRGIVELWNDLAGDASLRPASLDSI